MAALVFDLDGTIADSKQCIVDSIRHGLEQVGLSKLEFCEVRVTQQDLRRSFDEMMVQNSLPFEESKMLKFIEHYRRFHCEEAIDSIKAYEGVAETLDFLAKRFDLAVATTKHSGQAIRVLKKLGLDQFFNHIQGTDPGLRYKPEPDILYATLRRLNQTSESAVYIGDSLHDIHAARAAGMRAIGAAYGFAGDQHLRNSEPDWMIYRFSELVPLSDEILNRLNQSKSLSNAI